MGILDFLTAKKYKDDKNSPTEEIQYLHLKDELKRLNDKRDALSRTCLELDTRLNQLKYTVSELEDTLSIQSYGFHETKYGFENSTLYKNKLAEVRDQQKQLIKDKAATHHNPEKEFILDTIKLTLRTFNSECENIITKAKHSNLEASEKRIHKVFDEINNLTHMQEVSLSKEYLNLKIAELYLKHEYEFKKHQEKEEQAVIKDRLKEEAKTLKELESTRKKLEKDELRFQNTINEVHTKLESATESEQAKLLKKLTDTEAKLKALTQTKQAIQSREQNVTAGYVYIISNMGSFGEDVYKIGMTRKLDPEESIKELNGLSVPFNFDIHAMIFSEDAIALEKKLHKRFSKNQLNKVNATKNFFKVPLSEIEDFLQTECHISVELIPSADAEEYRKSCSPQKTAMINSLIVGHVIPTEEL